MFYNLIAVDPDNNRTYIMGCYMEKETAEKDAVTYSKMDEFVGIQNEYRIEETHVCPPTVTFFDKATEPLCDSNMSIEKMVELSMLLFI